MPFELKVTAVKRLDDGRLDLTCRVKAGAFAGPEAVEVVGQGGALWPTVVVSYEAQAPEGWPITPSHNQGVVTVRLPAPAAGFEVDPKERVVGYGALLMNDDRVDLTGSLDGALAAVLLAPIAQGGLADDEAKWAAAFGTKPARLEAAWTRVVAHHDTGAWPFLRGRLGATRYLEVELARSVEVQTRLWVGDEKDGSRLLLGWSSPHASLPALRVSEALALAARLEPPSLGALLLPFAARGATCPPIDLAALEAVLARAPGSVAAERKAVAQALAAGLEEPSLEWTQDEALGWVNDGDLSQRNPHSLVSVMELEEFARVRALLGG